MSTMAASPFEPSIWQIIRSSQKDDHYLSRLGINLDQSVKLLFGVRFWIRSQDLLANCNKLLYYLLTTTSGYQTLGEEYCNVLQFTSQRSVPSPARRLLLSLLYTFHSTLLNKFTVTLHSLSEKYIRRNVYSLDELKKDVQYVVYLLQSLNLAVFYFNGTYLDLSKRILSIGYLSTLQRQPLFAGSRSTSKLLGYLSLLQIVLSLYNKNNLLRQLPNCEASSPIATPDPACPASESTAADPKCLLCFSKRTNATLIECGHIFCWHCLTDWLRYKNECPTCRRAVKSNRLVFLHNYN